MNKKSPGHEASPVSCYFVSLGTKYLSQPSILKRPSLFIFLNVRDQIPQSYKTGGNIILLCVLAFIFFNKKREDKFGMKIKQTNAYKHLRVPYIAL
jgi:hypothetical protein